MNERINGDNIKEWIQTAACIPLSDNSSCLIRRKRLQKLGCNSLLPHFCRHSNQLFRDLFTRPSQSAKCASRLPFLVRLFTILKFLSSRSSFLVPLGSMSRRSSLSTSSRDVPGHLVDRVRSLVLQTIQESADKDRLFEESDVKRIETDDWFTRRFIVARSGSEDSVCNSAAEEVIKCMKWRKEIDVKTIMTGANIPRQLFNGFIVIDEEERVMIFRTRYLKKISGWVDVDKRHLVYMYETFDRLVGDTGGRVVFDFSGAKIANLDNEMGAFLALLADHCYPEIATSVWYYQLPWFLKPAIIILTALSSTRNAAKIVRITKEEALKAMGPDRLPDFMGGNKKLHPIPPPKDSPDIMAYAEENNLNPQQILVVLNEPLTT